MGLGSHSGRDINLCSFVLLFFTLTHTYPSLASSPSPSPSKNHTHLCLPNQRDALLLFKNAYNITEWDEHVDCCLWNGMTCNNISGDIIELDAFNLNLMGTINHITYLSPLHNLQVLDLSGNHLHGVVPPELSHFSKLKSLDLGLNEELRMESRSLKLLVQSLTQLEHLYLDRVKISGDSSNALVNISNALTDLSLYDCHLHGVLPESLFHLPNLLQLDLSGNMGLIVSFPALNWSSPLEYLDISSTNFSGKLPNSIGNLKNLTYLDLSSLHLSSPLPSSIGNLTRLTHLYLSTFARRDAFPSSLCHLSSLEVLSLPQNKFSGVIPQCLGNLTQLKYLDLSYNQLIGISPRVNFTRLEYLSVSSNIINDTVTRWLQFFPNLYAIDIRENYFHGEIPPLICKSTLWIVDLSNNSLSGTIPPCLFKNSDVDWIEILNLRTNKLEGIIPNTFPLNCTLVELDLSENRLKGPLPRSIINCSFLEVLELGNNSIEDSFPSWLETLRLLQVLVLKFNRLHGEVKTLLNNHSFPNLRIFDISTNNFSGLLPAGYIAEFDAMKDVSVSKSDSMYLMVGEQGSYDYSTTITMKGSTFILPKVLNTLKLMDFSNNNFHGEIPKIIGSLVALKGLNLSHNNLIGNIPLSIQNMTSLEWLDLSSNKLTGQIPDGLARLTELESLNLSHNELRGMIPKGKQFDTFGKESFEGNIGLCGSQIAIACGPRTPQQTPLPYIHEDNFNLFDWKIILMGYGCGLVIGLSVGYIVFELQKPKWLVSLVEKKLLKKIVRSRRRGNRLHRT